MATMTRMPASPPFKVCPRLHRIREVADDLSRDLVRPLPRDTTVHLWAAFVTFIKDEADAALRELEQTDAPPPEQ